MEESIAARLREINRQFYADHAEDFADTRPRLAAGVRRVLAAIPAGAAVLEVGCGDGKVGRALRRSGVASYVGVDESAAMLARATRYSMADHQQAIAARPSVVGHQSSVDFLPADITQPGWPAALPRRRFHWVLAFAVMHHVPGAGQRAQVMQALAACLEPGGRLVMSNWQLARSQRLLRRRRPWAEAGLAEADVEPGDVLLGWQRGVRRGLRYVHVIDEAEARALAGAAGLRVTEVFETDGARGDLAQYVEMISDADANPT